MFKSLSLAAAIAAVLAQDAPVPAPHFDVPAAGVTVPMLDMGGRPMIDAMINGKGPFHFILDTGADFPAVDGSVAGSLGLPAAAASGGEPMIRIGEFRIGDVVAHDYIINRFNGMLGRNDPAQPSGILSAEGFPDTLVILDYPKRAVTFRPGALPAPDNTRVFEYGADEELPVIPVVVAGHEIHLHLDSGSPGGITLPLKYETELPLASPLARVGMARTMAGTFAVDAAAVTGPVTIGAFTVEVPTIQFSDLRPGDKPGIGNVGGRVLRNFVVTVDGTHRRIRFDRP